MNTEEVAKHLHAIFEFKRKKAEALAGQVQESLGRVCKHVLERVRKGDLPEDSDLDCQNVRPFLRLVADPLELTPSPQSVSEHVGFCRNCQTELEQLEGLLHVIVVAEMSVWHKQVIADAPAEFMEKVRKLRNIQPEKITCEHARPHWRDMANCNLNVPVEIYRHAKYCNLCKKQVKQFRHNLGISFPDTLGLELECHNIPALEQQ